jgi:hypothetical protein
MDLFIHEYIHLFIHALTHSIILSFIYLSIYVAMTSLECVCLKLNLLFIIWYSYVHAVQPLFDVFICNLFSLLYSFIHIRVYCSFMLSFPVQLVYSFFYSLMYLFLHPCIPSFLCFIVVYSFSLVTYAFIHLHVYLLIRCKCALFPHNLWT